MLAELGRPTNRDVAYTFIDFRTTRQRHGIIEQAAQDIYFGRLSEMGPADTEFAVVEPEDQREF